QILRPDAIEVVLLAHVGQKARGGDEIAQPTAGSRERLLQIFHGEHGLLAHRWRQVELLVPMRMAMIDRGRRDAGQEDEPPACDDDARRIRHVDVLPAIRVVHDRDVLGHYSSRIFRSRSLTSRVPTVMRRWPGKPTAAPSRTRMPPRSRFSRARTGLAARTNRNA